jgi:Protein of unknown function (DUF3800)
VDASLALARSSFGREMIYLLPPRGEDKGIVVLQAFFDESGILDRDRICVIAGFVASARQWIEFDKLWKRIPDADITGFHAKRFFARDDKGKRVPPYTDWSDDRAAALLNGIVNAINHIDVQFLCSGVDVTAFRQYSLNARRHLTGAYWANKGQGKIKVSGAPTKPYYLAFQDVIVEALRCLKRMDWKVHFVFDQQHVLAPFALQLYSHMKRGIDEHPYQVITGRWGRRMGDIDFRSRQDAPPLQAADLLAYCGFHANPLKGTTRADIIGVLEALRANERTIGTFHSKTVMDELLEKGRSSVLEPPWPLGRVK